MLGTPLMPWQRLVVDTALEVDPDTGRLAYRECRLCVPRQSGKTTTLLALMTHRCVAMGDHQRVVFSAQTGKDARLKWEDDHVPVLQRSAFGRLMRVRRTNGSEAIRWSNGSLWSIAAVTATAAHGQQIDTGVIDEAFALQDDRLEQAFKPAMVTRPRPQLWVVSTAGTNESVYLNEKVDDGRLRAQAGSTSGICYFEWSAPDDAPVDDPATWAACMPALGRTVPVDAIRADFESMREPEFRRAYLNQRQDRQAAAPWQVIGETDWAACADPRSRIVDEPSLALDVTPSRSMASLCAAGFRDDGRLHVEVVGNRPGTSWVLDWFAAEDRVRRYRSVSVDPVGAAGSLAGELRALGLRVSECSTRSLVTACGRFYDMVVQGQLRHIDQLPLSAAVANAKRRPLGDAWAWHRRSPSVDVSPLVAATLALWAHAAPDRRSGAVQIVDPWEMTA